MRSLWKASIIVLASGLSLAISNQTALAGSGGHGGHGGHGSNISNPREIGRFFPRDRIDRFGLDGFGFGGFGLWGCDIGGNDERIPFYAVFPPVYYSRIVARPYGWTPFAYTPDAIILPLEESGSKEIINPYVPRTNPATPEVVPTPSTKAKPSSDRTADDSENNIHVVVNPYVGTNLAGDSK
ncbi:MAG TPA: hypothetical protein VKB78_07490 [Pirellulales bacterium]|nr:hypothetical protein [Pirellulales bacterium]